MVVASLCAWKLRLKNGEQIQKHNASNDYIFKLATRAYSIWTIQFMHLVGLIEWNELLWKD